MIETQRTIARLSALLAALALFSAAGAASLDELDVVQVVERLHDGRPSIAVILSDKLDATRDHDGFLEVRQDGGIVPGSWVLDDNRQTLYFPGVEPATRYDVVVRAGLEAANGKALASDHREQLTTRELRPMAGFASSGSVLPAGAGGGLPIRSVNVEAVDVEFLRVADDKVPQLAALYAARGMLQTYELDRLHEFLDSVYMARFATHGERNRQTITNVDVEAIDELARPGLYIAVLRVPSRFTYQQRVSLFFVSDVGLHVRRYADTLEIFSSSLDTGHALGDVRIELRDGNGNSIGSTVTGADGRATIAVDPAKVQLLTGTRGQHTSFVHLGGAALDLSEYDLAGRPQRPLEIFVYAPRNLYRPGETVEFSALLRTGDGTRAPPLPVHARLVRADGREAGRFTLHGQAHGYYAHNYTLPGDSPTGEWRLEVRADPADADPANVFRFLVEEFLPERMKLDLATALDWLSAEQRLDVEVTGAYLYGAPASGNRFTAALHLSANPHPLDDLDGFHFGAPDGFKSSKRELADAALDDAGRYTLELVPVEQPAATPVEARIVASLYETGGRPVTRSLARTVWPAERLVGVRPLFDEKGLGANGVAEFEVLLANPAGELLAAEALDVTLIRESAEYFWQYDRNAGWRYTRSESHYPVHRESLDIAAGDRVRLAMTVEWGRYRLEIRDPVTGLATAYRFYAGYYYWLSRTAKTAGTRPDQVTLSLDKPAYLAGETARLTIDPPHAGDAIVLVEDERLRWARRIEVGEDGATIDIPLDPAWNRHDLYVSAVVLRPASREARESPNRAVGIVHLPMERAHRELEVALETPERMEPERDLAVRVRVPDLAGRSATVTVAAVDVGVLSITDFETPDPFRWFFARRAYSPEQLDLYSRIIETLEGERATLRYGGDAAPPALRTGSRPNAKVNIVSLFSGPVALDASGNADVVLRVPDFNGRLRVMAVAFDDERFGSADTELTVRAPLVTEIAMPRFLASGDRSSLTVDLHNLSGRQQRFDMTLEASAPLALEPVARELVLEDDERVSFRYPLSAILDLGVGKVTITARNDDIDIARTFELAVRPPFPDEVRTQRGTINPGERIAIDPALLSGLMPGTVAVDVDISPLPPLALKEALENLLRYPYGCTEQTTSSAFPLVYADRAAQERFDLERLSEDERGKRLASAFTRLAGMQNAAGGFGLWRGDSPEDLWLTAYVSHFLMEAAAHGFDAPDGMRQKALTRLHRGLQSNGGLRVQNDRGAGYYFGARAYAGYLLARVNRAPLGTLRSLHDHHRGEASSGLALVHLGIALALSGDARRGDAAIREGIVFDREPLTYYGDYGTRLRDAAAILYLLKSHELDPDGRAGRLVFTLADELNARRWLSTQERNNLFLAGLALGESNQRWSGRVRAGGHDMPLERAQRYRARFDAETLQAGIGFESGVDFALYYSATVSGYRSDPPPPDDRHFDVRRRLLDLDGHEVGDRALEVGELLLVHGQVSAGRRTRDGLYVDFLPPGLELENPNLAHAPKLEQLSLDGSSLQALLGNERIGHTEYRDDRFVAAVDFLHRQPTSLVYLVRVVTPGLYRWPAPVIEDMYLPEIRGVGEGTRTLAVEDAPR